MLNFALGFVIGAWVLQQQTVLPFKLHALQPAWILACSLVVFVAAFTLCYIFKTSVFKSKFQSNLPNFFKKLAVFCAACAFGFVWAGSFAALRLIDELPPEWQQKSITIVGVVAILPEVTERGERFKLDVESVLTKTAVVPAHISLNFYRNHLAATTQNTASKTSFFHAGERWQFTVKLKRPHTTYNPHGFDFEAWALAENMRATGSISSKSGYKKLANFVYKPSYIIENCREKLGNYISQALVNKPYSGVIRALVVGDDSQISASDWNIYFRTGINHLMSISGLHITMLAGLAFSVLMFIWRRVPSLVLRMPARKAATIAGLVTAVLYAFLAGMSVPTQRTLLMLLTFALALLVGKQLAISRALALAVIAVVLFDPWAVIAPGFWLSFGAVALIAWVSAGRLKAASAFKTAINTQWAISLGLLPLLIVLFGQVSIISPIANAFAIPMISLAVVPLAILGSLLHVDFLLQIAHFTLQLCMQALTWLATLPTWQQAAPPMWVMLLAMFGVVWLLLPRGIPQRWLGFILMLPIFFVPPKFLPIGAMQATILDVGQGLSVVIKTANHTLLYDAGPAFSAQSDAGSRIVLPFLRGEGIAKLDGFVVSHDDTDHNGGVGAVLAQMPVTWMATSFDINNTSVEKSIRCVAGQTWQWDKVQFEVLYPTAGVYQTSVSDNNKSCVIKITSQFSSLLLTGDIEKEAEKILLEKAFLNDNIETDALQANIYAASGDAIFSRAQNKLKSDILESDVLVAPHHGSKTSSTIDFVQAVGASHVIFTNGYLNRFKHPKPLIEKRFEENGAITYRSDYQGAITIDFMQPKAINIKGLRQTQPRYWHDKYRQAQ